MARKPRLGAVNPALSTLTSAPDVREARRLRSGIAELEVSQVIVEGRLKDRLDIDVGDLKASIERNGQRVPILVRPAEGDRYRLIYGRRRLAACDELGIKVRAIVTELADDEALKDQLLENQERQDLSFIERALVASELLNGGFLPEGSRTNRAAAEIMNLTEAGVSQLLNVVRSVGEELILAIGPSPSVGRPRWEELKRSMSESSIGSKALVEVAMTAHEASEKPTGPRSDDAFLAVLTAAQPKSTGVARATGKPRISISGVGTAAVRSSGRGKRLELELEAKEEAFISWLEGKAPDLIKELHDRWKQRPED